jgi:hypothetical protein
VILDAPVRVVQTETHQGKCMFRNLFVLVIVGLLVACTTQGDGATDGTLETDASMVAEESGAAMGTATAACEESFAPLAGMEIEETSDLGDVPDEVQPTVEACESVADWIAGAQTALGIEVTTGGADFLLRLQCDDESLSDTAICEELSAP